MTLIQDLLVMSAEEFRRLVDDDLRGQATPEVSEALRSVAVIGRFRCQMQAVLAVVDGNLALKEAEVCGIVAKHDKWVASTGRFRSRLQVTLLEVVQVLHDQRDAALSRCRMLDEAILEHRAELDEEDATNADVHLWAAVLQD